MHLVYSSCDPAVMMSLSHVFPESIHAVCIHSPDKGRVGKQVDLSTGVHDQKSKYEYRTSTHHSANMRDNVSSHKKAFPGNSAAEKRGAVISSWCVWGAGDIVRHRYPKISSAQN